MPRNGLGTYTLPAGNPVVTGTTISSTTHNNTNNDIASALTQSISADGQTPWTGATSLFTGSTVPTTDLSNNSNQITNTEFVQKSITGRNLLINSSGKVNQRGYISGTATTGANQYTIDRWRVVVSGQALGFVESGAIRTMTAPAGGVEQVIWGANIIGGDYALNWEGTATATVNGSLVVKGGTFNLPVNTNATLRFTNGTFSKPMLEEGKNSINYEFRDFSLEAELCKAYFNIIMSRIVAYASIASQIFTIQQQFPVMIANPTITVFETIANINIASDILAVIASNGCSIQITSSSTGSIDYSKRHSLNSEL